MRMHDRIGADVCTTSTRQTIRDGKRPAEMMLPGEPLNTPDGGNGYAARGSVSQPARPPSMRDTMAGDAWRELVDFLVHRAFYPVLMVQRGGPDKAMIEYVQDVTRAEINRFRSYGSIEEVLANFERDFTSKPARDIRSSLRSLNLPVISDFSDDFQRKARELGVMD